MYLILLLQVQAVCFKLWENTTIYLRKHVPGGAGAACPDKLSVQFAELELGGLLWNEAAATKPFLPLTQPFMAHRCPVSQRGLTPAEPAPWGKGLWPVRSPSPQHTDLYEGLGVASSQP